MKSRCGLLMKVAGIVLAILCAGFITSCNKSSDGKKEADISKASDPIIIDTSAPQTGKGIVYGTVVDAQTGDGIADASIVLTVGTQGTLSTKTHAGETATDTKATLNQTAVAVGSFTIDTVPVGTFSLTISKDGYADEKRTVVIPSSDDPVYVPINGTEQLPVKLRKAFEAKVVVTAEGKKVPNALVTVSLDSDPYRMDYRMERLPGQAMPAFPERWSHSAKTDAGGMAVFTPPQNSEEKFDVLIPAFDANGDGIIDYGTFVEDYEYRGPKTVWSVVLERSETNNSPSLIASACSSSEEFGCIIQKTDSLYFIFNIPVSLAGGAEVVLEDTISPLPQNEVKVALALSGEGVVLTATPATPLMENHTYTPKLNGKNHLLALTYMSGNVPKEKVVDLRGYSLYIDPVAPLKEGDIIADNYNGKTNEASTSKMVYIKFPKVVDGTFTLKGYISNNSKTTIKPENQKTYDISGTLLIDNAQTGGCNASGCNSSSAYYRVSLLAPVVVNLSDNFSGVKNAVIVDITATDLRGNTVSLKDKELPVY